VNQDQIWSQVQEELRFQLAKRTYDMWLKNTSVVSADGGTFRIGVPSKLAKDWLEDRFSGLIQETLQAVTGPRTRCSTTTTGAPAKTGTRTVRMRRPRPPWSCPPS